MRQQRLGVAQRAEEAGARPAMKMGCGAIGGDETENWLLGAIEMQIIPNKFDHEGNNYLPQL